MSNEEMEHLARRLLDMTVREFLQLNRALMDQCDQYLIWRPKDE